MAEIPLLEYVAQIDSQLIAGAADEASYHSRHILGQFPRYATAFRLLGRALLLKGQFDEAEAAFRRVLGAYPADLITHLGLADLYDQRRRGDEAIWHAERALEIDVHHAATLDLMTALYRRYRNEERPRMGLTAVTLSRQAMQKHDYTQAVATLRDSLDRQPDRIDQRLLLAEALWESGDHVSGAETATDVLDSLPDCVSANTLLARLWLEVGRPSDARPYLNRLESLDPYWALAVITGGQVEASAFQIEPIDYQQAAQSDVARVEPDWIQGIPAGVGDYESDLAAPDWTSGMLSAAEAPAIAAPSADAPALTIPAAAGVAAAAWAVGWSGDDPVSGPAQAGDADEMVGAPTMMLSDPDLNDPMLYSPTTILGAAADDLNLFAEPVTDDFMPGLNELFGDSPAAPGPSAPPFYDGEPEFQPVAAAGVTSPLPPLEDPFSPEPMPPAEDAMAWLRESGVELIEDEAPEFSVDTGSEYPSASPADVLDPMAWLTTYDSVPVEPGETAEETAAPAGSAWQDENWDPNAVDMAVFAEPPADTPNVVAVAAGAASLRGLTSRLGDPSVTPPPAQVEPEPDTVVLDEWLAQFNAPAAAPEEPVSASPGWLNELGAEMTTDPELTPVSPEENQPEDENAGWLTEFSPDNLRSDLDAVVAETGSDWLAGATAAPDAAGALEGAGLPDWLVSAAPEATGAVAAAMAGERPELDSIPTGDEFDWLTTLSEPVAAESSAAPELDEAVLAAQADVPDWLDALESEALAQIDANQVAPTSDEAAALADEEFAAEVVAAEIYEPLPFDESAAFAAEEPEADWLAAGPAVAGAVAVAAVAGDWGEQAAAPAAEDWGSEVPASIEELAPAFEGVPPAQIEAEEAVPLEVFADEEAVAEMEAVAVESEPVEEWAQAVGEAEPEPASEQAPEAAPVDWGEPETADLARIAPPTVGMAEAPPAAEAPVAPDDWYADGALAAEEAVPADGSLAGAATGDWFADDDLLAPAEDEAGIELAAVETVSALTPDEESAAESESPEAESEFPAVDAALIAGGATALGVLAVDSMADETETAPGEAVALDELDEDEDWLSADWQDDAEAPVLEADELDELPDVEIAEETVIAPATNAPDWLNAMVPGLDMDFEAPEDAPVESTDAESFGTLDETLGARSEYAWVIDLVAQEEHETAPAEVAPNAAFDEPRFVFRSLPAWYRHDNGNGSDEDDFADWPSDDSSLPAYQN